LGVAPHEPVIDATCRVPPHEAAIDATGRPGFLTGREMDDSVWFCVGSGSYVFELTGSK